MSFSPSEIAMRDREEKANRLRHEGRLDERRRAGDRLRYWADVYEGNSQKGVAAAFRDLARQEFSS